MNFSVTLPLARLENSFRPRFVRNCSQINIPGRAQADTAIGRKGGGEPVVNGGGEFSSARDTNEMQTAAVTRAGTDLPEREYARSTFGFLSRTSARDLYARIRRRTSERKSRRALENCPRGNACYGV